jgi:hypothetical protein
MNIVVPKQTLVVTFASVVLVVGLVGILLLMPTYPETSPEGLPIIYWFPIGGLVLLFIGGVLSSFRGKPKRAGQFVTLAGGLFLLSFLIFIAVSVYGFKTTYNF